MRTFPLLLAALLLAPSLVFAGKPWRPAVDRLVPESGLIVTGTVTSLKPSLITDKDKRRYDIAEVHVTETLKGTAPKVLLVAVQTDPRYNEKGEQILISSAFRYELKQGDHVYLLFLAKSPMADAVYYVPIHSGSGIVDLNSTRVGDGPKELQTLRDYLREKKP